MTNVLDRPAPPPDLTLPYGPRPEHVIGTSRLSKAGHLVEIPGAGHFDLIDPLSLAWPQVLGAAR
jgi:hypothetical protein